jgi:hypothetical protein
MLLASMRLLVPAVVGFASVAGSLLLCVSLLLLFSFCCLRSCYCWFPPCWCPLLLLLASLQSLRDLIRNFTLTCDFETTFGLYSSPKKRNSQHFPGIPTKNCQLRLFRISRNKFLVGKCQPFFTASWYCPYKRVPTLPCSRARWISLDAQRRGVQVVSWGVSLSTWEYYTTNLNRQHRRIKRLNATLSRLSQSRLYPPAFLMCRFNIFSCRKMLS